MANEKQDITPLPPDPGSRFGNLPFGELIEKLIANGFKVHLKNIVEFTQLFEAFGQEDHSRLKFHLAPLVCRNQEDQRRFYQLFDEHYSPGSKDEDDDGKDPEPKRPRAIYYVIAGIALLLPVLWMLHGPKPPPPPQTKHYRLGIDQQTPGDSDWNNYPLRFSYALDPTTDYTPAHHPRMDWDLDDGTRITGADTLVHSYSRHRNYRVTLIARDSLTDSVLATANSIVKVFPSVSLSWRVSGQDHKSDVYPGDTILVQAGHLDTFYRHHRYHWSVYQRTTDSETPLRDTGAVMTFIPQQTGDYQFYFGCDTGDCHTHVGTSAIRVQKRDPLSLVMTGPSEIVEPEHRVSLYWVVGLILFILLCLVVRYLVLRKAQQLPFERFAPDEFEGLGPPKDVPFFDKDQEIIRLQQQSQASFLLRQRTDSDAVVLDIPETISRSARNLGFLTPAYEYRRRSNDYLILINARISHGGQYLKLFSYLIRSFAADNVNLSYYFYYDAPEKVYKDQPGAPLSIRNLRDMHYGSTLIVFSRGDEMLDSILPYIDERWLNALGVWEKRILVTPTPARDWGRDERSLGEKFHLIPADMEGLLTLIRFINEELPYTTSFHVDNWKTYASRSVDMLDIGSLRNYLQDKDLFQWVCALSVYNRVRWEVILEVGKQILARANASGKLNYNNLLRIARIKWIEQGAFPTSIRLAMLKELEIDNELVARMAMIKLMHESDKLIGQDSFTHEEKSIQISTDSFVLYAHDGQKNASFRKAAEQFMTLWKEKRVNDTALRAYLENPDHKWKTPINSSKGGRRNINADEFIDELIVRRVPPLARYLLWSALLGVLLLSGLLVFQRRLANLPLNQRLHFVLSQPPEFFDVKADLSGGLCLAKYLNAVRTPRIYLLAENSDGIQEIDSAILPAMASGGDTLHIRFARQHTAPFVGRGIGFSLRGGEQPLEAAVTLENESLFFQRYQLRVIGSDCEPDSATVSLGYDSTAPVDQLRSWSSRIPGSPFRIIASAPQKDSLPSSVVYSDVDLKHRATRLAVLLSKLLSVPVSPRQDTAAARRSGHADLLVWIGNISCSEMSPREFSKLGGGKWYLGDNLRQSVRFNEDSLEVGGQDDNDEYRITRVRACSGHYFVNAVNRDRTLSKKDTFNFQISFDANGLVVHSAALMEPGRYLPLFDAAHYSTLKGAADDDLGIWKVSPQDPDSSGESTFLWFGPKLVKAFNRGRYGEPPKSDTAMIVKAYRDANNVHLYQFAVANGKDSGDDKALLIIMQRNGKKYLSLVDGSKIPLPTGLGRLNMETPELDGVFKMEKVSAVKFDLLGTVLLIGKNGDLLNEASRRTLKTKVHVSYAQRSLMYLTSITLESFDVAIMDRRNAQSSMEERLFIDSLRAKNFDIPIFILYPATFSSQQLVAPPFRVQYFFDDKKMLKGLDSVFSGTRNK